MCIVTKLVSRRRFFEQVHILVPAIGLASDVVNFEERIRVRIDRLLSHTLIEPVLRHLLLCLFLLLEWVARVCLASSEISFIDLIHIVFLLILINL